MNRRIARFFSFCLALCIACAPIVSFAHSGPPSEEIWSLYEVVAVNASVLKGTSPDYPVVKTLHEGDTLYVREDINAIDGKWYECKTLEGKAGYIHMNLVEIAEEDEGAVLRTIELKKSGKTFKEWETERAQARALEDAQEPKTDPYKKWLLMKDSTTVYVTRNGSCYHYDSDCSNMKNPMEVSLYEAKEQGYRKCSKCW